MAEYVKDIYRGKYGVVKSHKDYNFHVVDFAGKHLAYMQNEEAAKALADKAPPAAKK